MSSQAMFVRLAAAMRKAVKRKADGMTIHTKGIN